MKFLSLYADSDFIEIENGVIHWFGYFYWSECWHLLQYKNFDTSIEDFVLKYNRDPAEAYNDEGVDCQQYILSEWDDPEYTEEYFELELEGWLVGATAIDPREIRLDHMPDGYYVLVDKGEGYGTDI